MNAITTNKSASNDETAVDDYYASSRFSKDPRTKQCIILPVRMHSHLSFLPTNNKNNNNTFLFFHSENQEQCKACLVNGCRQFLFLIHCMWLSFCVFLNTRYKPYNVKEVDPIMCHLCRRPIAIFISPKAIKGKFSIRFYWKSNFYFLLWGCQNNKLNVVLTSIRNFLQRISIFKFKV